MLTLQFSVPEIIGLGALAVCFFAQLYFAFYYHAKLASWPMHNLRNSDLTPISVIICARNEANNLKEYLPMVLHQNYPQFEVVVVNDRSWDETGDILEAFSKEYPNLKVVNVAEGEKFRAGKKFAVTMGIKASSYNWLVFTDADCLPATENWLTGMLPQLNNQTEIVLGYSPYLKKRGLLNALIRFETFFTAVNYLSFALRGNPYMGVGRNMAYKKELFFKSKGFAAHMHVPSGDDDLFVNANANSQNTEIQIHQDAHVWSEPKTTWASYLSQKKRHVGAGKLYKAKHKFVLSFQVVVQFLFYVLLGVLFCFKTTLPVAGAVFVLSIALRSFVYPKLLKRLNCCGLAWWFPVLDVLLFVFLVINAILSIFVKKVVWK